MISLMMMLQLMCANWQAESCLIERTGKVEVVGWLVVGACDTLVSCLCPPTVAGAIKTHQELATKSLRRKSARAYVKLR